MRAGAAKSAFRHEAVLAGTISRDDLMDCARVFKTGEAGCVLMAASKRLSHR
jgi:hypothetical protein